MEADLRSVLYFRHRADEFRCLALATGSPAEVSACLELARVFEARALSIPTTVPTPRR